MSYEGLRVLITGSTRGIGKAAAQAFLERGARVAINGRRAEDVAATIAELGGANMIAAPGDMASAKACSKLVWGAIEGLGGLDVLVNNAGVFDSGPVVDVSEETYDWMMDINVKGVFFCSKAAIPELRRNKGSIVMTASESGLSGNKDTALYCTSKGAVVNMTRALAHDLAPDIRVNAVCPGAVMTDMVTGGGEPGDLTEMENFSPMKRIGTPKEIGEAICFLADPTQKFMTGALLAVDGGSTACR
ncbi:MAG: SDR family oxidoreductase [Rhodospirillaceae bacterium]|jgi:NAD(P)-dependent dehydrogenase (short-subunit alcohol dehydrogenase family)|nr:SDR family oxidoreductase [Rhodospirillaceae bacterium]MBT6509446.1 SDR family oxidoreductase [Rhodospirillaceae bacterium]MBT7613280.1 SDR family oxidoreductase [Rhodospirillaceae bacterium]MBT7649288.1 SDR family oxidoreductase [Rhodospirillaceae bacterium]